MRMHMLYMCVVCWWGGKQLLLRGEGDQSNGCVLVVVYGVEESNGRTMWCASWHG